MDRFGRFRMFVVIATSWVVGAAGAGSLYWSGGTSDIDDGIAQPTDLSGLSGTWDDTAKNWATAPGGTTYAHWTNGGVGTVAWLGNALSGASANAVVTVAGDLSLEGIRARWTNGSAYGQHLDLDASAPRTLAFAGSAPYIDIIAGHDSRHVAMKPNIRATGSGLTLSGTGGLYVYGDWSGITGELAASLPLLQVYASGASGKMTGVSRFLVRGGTALGTTLRIQQADGANDVLGDNASVLISGGNASFDFYGYGGATATETISKIILRTHGIIDVANRSAGSASYLGQLILTDGIDRGPDGKGTFFLETQTDGSIRSSIIVANGTPNTRLPWAGTTRATGVMLDANKALVPVPWTLAPTDVSTWVADQTYVLTNGVALSGQVPNLTIKSLGILRGYNETLTIGAGNTLTLSEGQIIRANGGGAVTFDISGGKITSGNGSLYLFAAQNANQTFRINSEITGDIDVITAGGSDNIWIGAATNTFTGTLFANAGRLQFTRTNNVVCCPGDLIVGDSATVICSTDGQIAPTSDITIRERGNFTLGDNITQSLGGVVTIDGGRMVFNYTTGDVLDLTHAGTPGLVFYGGRLDAARVDNNPVFRILTDVGYAASSTKQALVTSMRSLFGYPHELELTAGNDSVTRTWDIADSTTLPEDTAEMVVMPSLGANGNSTGTGAATLRKTGEGALLLRGYGDRWVNELEVVAGTVIADSAVDAVIERTGEITDGSAVVRVSSTVGIKIGQRVLGPGIPNRPITGYDYQNSFVASIDSPTQLTLNNPVALPGYAAYPVSLRFVGRPDTVLTLTGNIANGSPVVSALSSTSGMFPGQPVDDVSGGNIPDGSSILSVDGPTQVTLTANATATVTGKSLAFGTFQSIPAFGRHIVQTGVLSTSSPVVTGLASTQGLMVGQRVYGSYSGLTTNIKSIDGPTQVTMVGNPFSGGSQSLTFWGTSPVGRSTVTVDDGGTFGGTGAAGAVVVTAGGTLDPGGLGHASGTLTAGSVEVRSGATLKVDLAPTSSDSLVVYGNLTVAGVVSPRLTEGFKPTAGTVWTLATLPDGGTIDITAATVDEGFALGADATHLTLTRSQTGGTVVLLR